MKKILFGLLAVSTIALTACEKEETKTNQTTNATITLKSNTGTVSGITVYAYDQTTWDMHGDEKLFSKGQATSNDDGNAIFSNIEYPAVFNSINNNQNNFTFSAHYSKSGVNRTKSKSVTVNKGDQVKLEIFLD